MYTSEKYLIHAEIRTSGVVERSDVVGAIFGQTEGLLGDELELRNLRESSKIGRIDVNVESENGRTFGTIAITSELGRVETAVLGAALESIERVGPCRAELTIDAIEDAREAKRREVVDRATELLAALEEETLTGDRLVDEVRERAHVAEIQEYGGLPAGPRVADSDAIILVEGRSDVRNLLQYGIKNAIAIEGTDVPDSVGQLTRERTVTAFLDGDRGGDLIVEELQQVGEIDYVAFAPPEQSVEDLDRPAVIAALEKKVPSGQIADGRSPRDVFEPDEERLTQEPEPTTGADDDTADADSRSEASSSENGVRTVEPATVPTDEKSQCATSSSTGKAEADEPAQSVDTRNHRGGNERKNQDKNAQQAKRTEPESPQTLAGHISAVTGGDTETVRLLDEENGTIAEGPAAQAVELVADAETDPAVVIIDGTVTQGLLDVAAQRTAGRVIGTDTDEFVKRPASVRVQTADQLNVTA
jgi:DNA primase